MVNQDQCQCQALEYRNFKVYAEGTDQTLKEFLPDVLRSVASEFECIDQIYETGIQCGVIQDAEGNIEWLLEKLCHEKEIVILGTGIDSQNAYDYLLGKEIETCCFMSENWTQGRLLGKNVLSESKIKEKYKNAVFLDCETENSAWGFGKTDRYDCEGYFRNKSFFCLKDYEKISTGGLSNTLKNRNVILVGNFNLCCNLNRILKEIDNCNTAYWDVLNENSKKISEMTRIVADEAENADIYLLVEPFYFGRGMESKRPLYIKKLQERGIDNITEYFSDSRVFMSIQKKGEKKYTLSELTPGKILLGASGHMCGNVLFRHLLDGHPNIVFLMEHSFLRNNLCIISMWLAEEKAENMLSEFWRFYDNLDNSMFKMSITQKEVFGKRFTELLASKDSFTSQEVFTILNIAGAAACGQNDDIKDIHKMLIYWEPHDAPKEICNVYEEWLSDRDVRGFSINIIRNSFVRAGSYFKCCENSDTFVYPGLAYFWSFLDYTGFSNAEVDNWKRIEIKFEDLKISPKEIMDYICNELEIPWSDTLLETTVYGKKASYVTKNDTISGFDLKPVYNLYEEYFSDFDRFRINMVFADSQKRGNYPFVSCRSFTKRQLQEMFLKEFRFEDRLDFKLGVRGKIEFRKNLLIKVNEHLQRFRRKELLEITQ